MADVIVINLYRNNSDPSVLNKDLDFVRIFRGVFREPFDIVSPVLLLNYNNAIDFNYIEIPSLQRFYFVSNCTNISSGLWAIELSVDVLQSYQHSVLDLTAIIERNEHTYDSSIIDTMQVYEAGHSIKHYYGYDLSEPIDNSTPRYVINASFFSVGGGAS